MDANEFVSSFDRENLVLTVTDKISPAARVRDFLDAHRGQAGIIYCATREQVDNLTAALVSGGYPALPYHAGMEDEQRRAHQRRFRYEEGIIMVATIAFGMGINKSNLRFILHYNLPKNFDSYYQQIGRAGRDGLSADCLLLVSFSDVHTIRHFISQKPPELHKGAQKRLQAILRYVDSRTCRRIPLLAYFGEKYSGDNCGACDRCLQAEAENIPVSDQTPGKEVEKKPTKVDLSDPARMFIACAMETGEFFGAEHLINVLRGSKAKKVLGFKHDELPSHGCGRDYSKEEWQRLAAQFISKGLLNRTQPHGSLRITVKGSAVLQGEQVWGTVPGRVTRTAGRDLPPHDRELFSNLRILRARLAQERKIPPYIIFTDRSLMEMAVYYPQTPLELGKIYGVGVRKLDEYGSHFLKVIRSYCKENGIQAKEKKKPTAGKRRSTLGKERTEYIWKHFQAGESIVQIASDLGFKETTIYNHFKYTHDAGLPLDAGRLRSESPLSQEDERRVVEAFEEHGTEYLRPVFNALDETVSYDQLRLWRVICLVNSPK